MTLVLAMYDYDTEWSFDDKPAKLEGKPSGILTIADSVITAFGKPTTKLVTSFRKTYEVEIKVFEPNFNNDGSLRNYLYVQSKHSCLLSIAGSTLVAQHVLNIVTTHLGNLLYTYDFKKREHQIIRNCQPNPLTMGRYSDWDSAKSSGLLNADYINETVIHSIKHIIDATAVDRAGDISQIGTNFLLSFQCPKTNAFYIYQYDLSVSSSGELEIKSKKIARDDIGIIGMTKEFYEDARSIYLECLQRNEKPKGRMIEFMKAAIDKVHKTSYEIDYPVIIKRTDGRKITKELITAPTTNL